MLFLLRLFLSSLIQIIFFSTAWAEVNQDERLVQNIKEISIQFQWGDLVSSTQQLNPNSGLDVGISSYLLAYHQSRLLMYNIAKQAFLEAPSRSELVALGLKNHPLSHTIDKLISIKEFAENSVGSDGASAELYQRYFNSKFSNQIDWYLWCQLKLDINFNKYATHVTKHAELSDFDCEPYNQSLGIDATEYTFGSVANDDARKSILQLEIFYTQAPSIYEKLVVLQELGSIAVASLDIDTLVRAAARYSSIVRDNNITDAHVIKFELMFKQALRSLWPEISSSRKDSGFQAKFLGDTALSEYLEIADVIEIKLMLDGLLYEHGYFSQQATDAFAILKKRLEQEIAKTDHESFDFIGWSLIVPRLYFYQLEVIQDEALSLMTLSSFVQKWEEQNLNTTEQLMFDEMPKLFAAQTSFVDIEKLILNDQSLEINSPGGRLISRIYLNLAEHLSLFGRVEEAGPYIYKALFNLPNESRIEWEEILLLYDELETYHLYENKSEILSAYLSLKIIETAELKMLGTVQANYLLRFEDLDDIRQTLVNSIFNLRFSYFSETDYAQSAKLKDVMYNAIQLLRLNRVTFIYTGKDIEPKEQISKMNRSKQIVDSIVDNKILKSTNQIEETNFNLGLRSLESFQIWIPEDTAIIVAFDGLHKTNFAFIDRLNFDPLFSEIDRDELNALVEQILDSVRYDTASGRLPEFDFENSNKFYTELFGNSYAQMMMEGKKNIIFMPSKSLYNFPLTLLSNGGRLLTSYDEITTYNPQSFIIDKYNISHLIEITDELIEDTFVEQLSTSPRRSGIQSETFLGVANPHFGRTKTALLRGLNFISIDEFEDDYVEFSSLPETINEVESASKIFDPRKSKILAGKRATKANFLAENLNEYDVIMLSTHGLTPGEISGFEDSALVLAKDPELSGQSELTKMLLSSDDIIETSLDADLVMMNACSTGISNTKGAPGLTGLAQSFLAAGAQSVMVSHWNVASEQTVKLTELMFESLANNPNLSYAGALQEAQVKVKNQAATQHPFYWAPFTIYNDFN